MPQYSDRPWYEFFIPREAWYQMKMGEYHHYYEAQKSIADERLTILQKAGVHYDAQRHMYIKESNGEAIWT